MKTTSNNNNVESKSQSVYVTVANGIVQDVFTDKEKAIKDMRRHVYNTLVDCCGGKVESDDETCCVVSCQGKERNDVCMVVPFDPNNREHRKAYNAQRDSMGLPELPAITEAEGVKAAIKREQNDACISSAERERARLDIKVGDKVCHNLTGDHVATVTAIREAFVNVCAGYRYVYTLDFGESVKGPFDVDLNGGEFLREAFTPCTPDECEHEGETLTASLNVIFDSREDYERGKQLFDSEGASRLWAADWADDRQSIQFCEAMPLDDLERDVRSELDAQGFENYATVDGEEMWV